MATEATITKRQGATKTASVRHDARSIESDLQRRISAHFWLPGQKLPSRRELASQYGVALATIERACSKLVSDGMLTANGRGTLVSEGIHGVAATSDPVALPRFSRGMAGISVGVINALDCGDKVYVDGNGWTVPTLSALEAALGRAGGRTVPFKRSKDATTFAAAIESMQCEVDAIIVLGLNATFQIDEALAGLRPSKAPIVCITPYDLHLPVPAVFFDNWTAGYQAAEHALLSGRKRLIYIGPAKYAWSQQRQSGAIAAAEHFGLNGNSITVITGSDQLGMAPYDEDILIKDVDQILSDERDSYFDAAIIAANDTIGVAVKKVLALRHLNAGRDYCLTGFDNSPQSREDDITTVRPPLEDLGEEAAALVANYIHGNQRSTKVCIRCQLIVRSSSIRDTPSNKQ